MKDFDDVMTLVGINGRYQLWVILAIIGPSSMFVAITTNLLLFQVKVPDHWCHVPGRENTSHTLEEWKNLTIPREKDELSKCLVYKVEWPQETRFIIHNETEACAFGWDHDSSEFEATLSSSHEWVCEKEMYSGDVFSVNMAGNTIGTLILPAIGDRYIGRRLIYFVVLFIAIVFTVPVVFVSNFGFHLTLRFFAALSFESTYMMPYIIGLEFVAPEKRTMVTFVSFTAWTVGMCFTSLLAWLIPHWKHLALFSCVPPALSFLYWWYLPESPRWLLSQGRIYDCASILLQVAKSNGKNVSRARLEAELSILWNQQEKDVSLKEVLQYPVLRVRGAILFVLGACNFLCYGLVYLGITVLSSNYFVSHFVLSISSVPANTLGWLWTHYFGRRFTCVVTFLVAAVFLAAVPFSRHDKWLMLAMVAMIRLCATQSIYVVFMQCTEIFPTPVRSMGLAGLMISGLATMISTPYLLHSGISEDFPYLLLLAMMLLCAVLGSVLPETIGLPLPQTFQDAEELGKGRPFMSWVHHWNQHKFAVVSTQEEHYQELKKLSNLNP